MEKAKRKYARRDPLSPNLTVDQYREAKMEMLKSDMKIHLTYEQELHFRTLKTEMSIDNYARKVMFDAWDK